ncbi:MAG TPA: succinyl-diaminopimelate desuccinylase [Candidatus Nitrosotalea sp.]|nr:succinyl-diaminopimelate desuccinylase [Candidatus Nitrosotalea sp.]
MSSDAERLTELAVALVAIPSVSGHEQAITTWIADQVEAVDGVEIIHRQADALVFGRPGPWDVVLAGHTDTVPEQGNLPPRVEDGSVHGLGAADMKGSLAVMLALAREVPTLKLNPVFVVFGKEEVSFAESVLTPLLGLIPELTHVPLALVMEPTANQLHAGCLGNINAELTFHGRAAHSARPWLGVNAIAEAVRGLAQVVDQAPHDVVIDGLTYREVLSVTEMSAGIANNVIPDRARCVLNFRYAGNRSPAEAELTLRQRVGEGADLRILSHAPGAPASLSNPVLQRLRAQGLEVRPKQAWTPAAEFAASGVEAVNFGPGDPDFAHRRDERVSVEAMVSCLTILRDFLCV